MRNFLQLLLLAAMWAPSFVLIKIGLTGGLDAGGDAGYPPVILASLRVALGALFMLSILKFKGRPLPRDRESWMRVLPMGLFRHRTTLHPLQLGRAAMPTALWPPF